MSNASQHLGFALTTTGSFFSRRQKIEAFQQFQENEVRRINKSLLEPQHDSASEQGGKLSMRQFGPEKRIARADRQYIADQFQKRIFIDQINKSTAGSS